MSDPPSRDSSRRFVGGLMLACGALITLLCGSCTGVFIGPMLAGLVTRPAQNAEALPMLAIPLFIGGSPTLAGIVLAVEGWKRVFRPPPGPR